MRFRSVGERLKNLDYKVPRSLRTPKKHFIADAKLIFRSAVGYQRSPFFLNVNPENFRIAGISFFPGGGVRARARRERYGHGGACTTAGRKIVHSRVIIHRSPSSALPAAESRGSCGKSPPPLSFSREEFCPSAPRQAGYCRIPLRGLSLGLVEATAILSKPDRGLERDGDEDREPFTAARFGAILPRDLENGPR